MKPFINLEYAEHIKVKPKESINRKTHHHYTIELVTKGKGYLKVGNKEYTFSKGDVYLLWKGEGHAYGPDPKDPWDKDYFNFNGEFADYLSHFFQLKRYHKFPNFAKPHLFKKIIKLYQQASQHKNDEFAIIIMEFFLELKKYHSTNQEQVLSPIVTDMIQFIEQHIDKPISMLEIAKHVQKSIPQIIRLFKKDMHTTPYQHLLNKRMDLAKYHLIENMLSIKEIAYRLQFADEFYFSNFFKSKEGISPREYKRQKIV